MPKPTAPVSPDSFYVGGQYLPHPGGGHLRVGQMYVRRFEPAAGDHLPVVLIHGAAQTGHHYEATPDGRLGLAPLLAALGRPAYVVDLPGIGRSGYAQWHAGPLEHYSAERIETVFTSPAPEAWPAADLHTQWPGSGRRGDPTFDDFYASQVGTLPADADNEATVRAAGAALADRIGPCHLLTHSRSGPYGWHIADARPELIRSVVALEPQGPPFFDPLTDTRGEPRRAYGITSAPLRYDPPLDYAASGLPFDPAAPTGQDGAVRPVALALPARKLVNLQRTPVLVVTGEASYHAMYDQLTVDFLQATGVPVEHARLGERGIYGNGHLLAIEMNNTEIAELVHTWLTTTELCPPPAAPSSGLSRCATSGTS
jgi:pimeloyl-ACP methyl ester carboxylesterase